jgi:hypothetical protein
MQGFEESIFPYLLKEYLIYLIDFLAVTVVLLLLVLIVHKSITEYRAGKRKRYYETYREMVENYIIGTGPAPDAPGSDLQFDAFAHVCIEMLSRRSGRVGWKIKRLLRDSGTVDHFREMARSGSWTKRFYAVEVLGYFMIDDLKDLFKDILTEDENPDVKAKALWALSRIAEREDMDMITKRIADGVTNSSKFNEHIFTNMIESLRMRGDVSVLIGYLGALMNNSEVPVSVKRDLIAACGVAGLDESAGSIEACFKHYHDDSLMKIACIRALGAMGHLDEKIALQGLSDRDWRVRAVAARATCRDGQEVLKSLKECLYDPVYVVRINAARKLAHLGKAGLALLANERYSRDPFVRDTVNFIMEEAESHV